MSRKTSTARREAFFRALAETGNRTLAAERAKVSQSWVTLHRSTDPEFRARIDAAVAEAKARLGQAEGMAPPSGWGSLDGEELTVRAGRGRRTQIARARLTQWTPRVEERFLSVLAATCNVKAACDVGMSVPGAYKHARRWSGFGERWREAVEIGYMRIEAGLLMYAEARLAGGGTPVIPELQMPPMTIEQAIQLLHMHKHQVRGVGKRPGHMQQAPDMDKIRASILRKIEAIERHELAQRTLDPAMQAQDRREWERRQGGGGS
jgi:hypothetical protein